jgi:choline dehydrogenase-like flavoprotein
MFMDTSDFADGESLNAGICIVGAGPAGISLALSLSNSGIDVLLLESGGLRPEAETQALYAGSVADEQLHSPTDTYRQRRFGGSSTIWGGRCMPFDPIDFEDREYIPHSGWPIGYDDLAPYYPEANRLCEAGDFEYTAERALPHSLRDMIAGFSSRHFRTDKLERFSCPTDFGARYEARLRKSTGIRVLMHANVVHIGLSPNTQFVSSVDVKSLDGRKLTVTAQHFILAVGGLEVARLLLASNDRQSFGIGNEHDLVGRYYMCHIAGTIGTLRFNGPRDSVWHGYEMSPDGIYCRRRIALRTGTQRRLGLGNFVARLHHPRITDPAHRTGILSLLYLAKAFIPYEYGKRLHGEERSSSGEYLQHVVNLMRDPGATAAFMWHLLRDRKLSDRKFPSIIIHPRANRYSLDFHAEQRPNPSSRVSISQERDALGLPRIHVDWRYTTGDVETVRQSLALLASDLQDSGLGSFDYEAEGVEHEMTRYGAYGGHHIGTTRMGFSPRTSVVNSDCRVHGIENLYIASASTFPTSSQANPTLTIVAMALRLGAHLRRLERRVVPLITTNARGNRERATFGNASLIETVSP